MINKALKINKKYYKYFDIDQRMYFLLPFVQYFKVTAIIETPSRLMNINSNNISSLDLFRGIS